MTDYKNIARRDFEREIYKQCEKEDREEEQNKLCNCQMKIKIQEETIKENLNI